MSAFELLNVFVLATHKMQRENDKKKTPKILVCLICLPGHPSERKKQHLPQQHPQRLTALAIFSLDPMSSPIIVKASFLPNLRSINVYTGRENGGKGNISVLQQRVKRENNFIRSLAEDYIIYE